MTGPIIIDAEEWTAILRALVWVAFFGGVAGAVALDLLWSVWRLIERRMDRRRGYDDFADAVERVVSKMDRARG